MLKANMDIRQAARQQGLRLWQVAEAMGIDDSAFSRKLRRELPPEVKTEIFEAIERASQGGERVES